MKKHYKLDNLDCANCAAKMEDAIRKIEGVRSANVSFMAQKLNIEVDDESLDRVMREVGAAIAKIEPDCRVIM